MLFFLKSAAKVQIFDDTALLFSRKTLLSQKIIYIFHSFAGISLMNLAGLPATMALAGTSFVTTAAAATTAFSPIVTPGRIVAPAPIHALRQMCTGLQMRIVTYRLCSIRKSLNHSSRVHILTWSAVDNHDLLAHNRICFNDHSNKYSYLMLA